ncbi:hypothetical protein GOP47_0023506 [Adiantum capillus-veneris]|uniref:NTF2 domain-containing protein n=1 Tax=Adiantum capillus-veneris TaxID=13818 RepID=A0A9D4Z5Z4_ADICA|nr:hypothetical protein GOP47_0023506 [Adiantum capillus-veneris]
MDPEQIGRAFVDHYYSIFDTNRPGLVSLYQDGSMLTFEGQKLAGAQAIVSKLTSLAFQQCKHNVSTVDCQLSGPGGGMLVFVNGNMQLPGEEHALKFSQVMDLCTLVLTFNSSGSCFCSLPIMRYLKVISVFDKCCSFLSGKDGVFETAVAYPMPFFIGVLFKNGVLTAVNSSGSCFCILLIMRII